MVHRKILLLSSVVLVFFVLSVANAHKSSLDDDHSDDVDNRDFEHSERDTSTSTSTRSTHTTRRTTKRTTTYDNSYDAPHKYYNNGKNRKGYGGRDDHKPYEYDYRKKGGSYDSDEETIGHDGIDSREYGQDKADFGPIHDNKESMYGSMDVWVSAVDDWEEKRKPKSRNNYNDKKQNRGNNYNDKNKKYKKKDEDDDDNDYKKPDRKKRSYSRVRFPVRHFQDIRKFPMRRQSPLISIFPWLPIFYDKITYQTLIFSPTGGIYILPPLINFYGQRFAVAQLIKWGYASLVSSGAPPPPNVNVAPLVQPAPVVGTPSQPVPTYDEKRNAFKGGVRTDFPTFKPRYDGRIGGPTYYNNDRQTGGNNYGSNSNYDGASKQGDYDQGGNSGPQNGNYDSQRGIGGQQGGRNGGVSN